MQIIKQLNLKYYNLNMKSYIKLFNLLILIHCKYLNLNYVTESMNNELNDNNQATAVPTSTSRDQFIVLLQEDYLRPHIARVSRWIPTWDIEASRSITETTPVHRPGPLLNVSSWFLVSVLMKNRTLQSALDYLGDHLADDEEPQFTIIHKGMDPLQ